MAFLHSCVATRWNKFLNINIDSKSNSVTPSESRKLDHENVTFYIGINVLDHMPHLKMYKKTWGIGKQACPTKKLTPEETELTNKHTWEDHVCCLQYLRQKQEV